MFNLKVDTYLKLIFIISLISIISAYFIEYILGYQPCNLCLIERIPYGLSLVLIIINYVLKNIEKFILLLLIIIFIFSFSISVYHFGIEQGFFSETLVCEAKNLDQNLSKEDILKQLSKNNISCKTVTFRVLGLSLASINTIFSFVLFVIFLRLFRNYENNK